MKRKYTIREVTAIVSPFLKEEMTRSGYITFHNIKVPTIVYSYKTIEEYAKDILLSINDEE